jgi:hypothetical protein
VPGVAAGIVRRDLDATLADGRGPQEVDSEPPEMGQSVLGRDMFDRATNQSRGRPGVLMVRMPRATGQLTGVKHAVTDFAIGCVQ